MVLFEAFVLGFVIKVITGVDDMLTRVPVLAAFAKTRRGRVAFSLGAICAVATATVIAWLFSDVIEHIPSYETVVALLIFALAIAIQGDVFVHKPQEKVKEKLEQKIPNPSFDKLSQLFGIGYVASFATVLDDAIAYLPVFFGSPVEIIIGVSGILIATVCQAIVVILFAEQIARIPYKEEITFVGLVTLGILILTGVL